MSDPISTHCFKEETNALREAWMRHDAQFLDGYLVSGVEDPRIHFPSLLTRGLMVESLFPGQHRAKIWQEYRFGICMSYLQRVLVQRPGLQTAAHLLRALERGQSQFKAIEIPSYFIATWEDLQRESVPENYLLKALNVLQEDLWKSQAMQEVLETFARQWHRELPTEPPFAFSVMEPACGSANDYRALVSSGLARLVQYQGFDLCPKNIDNAIAMFPEASFSIGNVFDVDAADKSVDFLYLHDLFEHLSPEGMEQGICEVARITRGMACLGFFNTAMAQEHQIQKRDGYHWNRLSLSRLQERLEPLCQELQMIPVASFLRHGLDCADYHNPGSAILVMQF
jgi:hypothetical protein